MAKPVRSPRAYSNAVLHRLSPPILKRLSRHLQPVDLVVKQVLCEAGEKAQYVYFVEVGMVSVVAVMQDSRAIEVGTIGNEGLVGSEFMLGSLPLPYRRYVQMGGNGFRMGAEVLQHEFDKSGELRNQVLRCHASHLVQSMQSAACNGLHSIEQRCCRWILAARDHAGTDTIPLTHEFLAIMLGVRRASVTDVLKPLQARGLIQSVRGVLTILKRSGLEAKACECYAVIAEHQRLLRD